MRRTIWLASYPKSGNTWTRLLIASLGSSRPVDINGGEIGIGIASARGVFDHLMMLPSGLLRANEVDRLRPAAHRALTRLAPEEELLREDRPAALAQHRFVKTHDAYLRNDREEPILGGAAAAAGAILIVRDPRDVAASLAHHQRSTIDGAIEFMSRRDAAFSDRTDRQTHQLRQQLLDWSGFQASWLDQRDLPVHIVTYEALQRDTAAALKGMLDFAGVTHDAQGVAQAVALCAFERLREQEQRSGFREAPMPRPDGQFFRRGKAGGWRDELTDEQAAAIAAQHGAMMERLGYAR